MRKLSLLALVVVLLVMALPSVGVQAQWCSPRADWTGTHVINRGENLYRIAKQYGLSSTQLAQGNCIANINRIYAGQTLRVPAAQQPVFYTATMTDTRVRLRQGPGTNYGWTRLLDRETVTVYGRSWDTNWLLVQTARGDGGWVFSYYVGLDGSLINNLPIMGAD
jgi:LysM repeat protein